MKDIDLLVSGEVFCAQLSPNGEGVWNIFFGRNQVEDDFVGLIFVENDHIADTVLSSDTIIDREVWGEIVHEFLRRFSEKAYETYDELCEREDIPEQTSPMMDIEEIWGFPVESVKSCIDSTDFVLATSIDDSQVMLARILHNQKTILAHMCRIR